MWQRLKELSVKLTVFTVCVNMLTVTADSKEVFYTFLEDIDEINHDICCQNVSI